MRSNSVEEAFAAFDALDAVLDRIAALGLDELTTREWFRGLERLETARRRLPVAEHRLINQISDHATAGDIGDALPKVVADRLRITKAEASRRISDAELLGYRYSLTGERLQPTLSATAEGQRAGQIGVGHIREIRRFLRGLPAWVDETTRQQVEADLAGLSATYRPDEVRQAGERIAALLNPDGDFSDRDRARRRGLTIGG